MTTRPEPRPEVTRLPEMAHGAVRLAELRKHGLASDEVLDFSANVNPFGPPPEVRDALRRVAVDRYPDRDALLLREAIARYHDLTPEHICPGNGVSELILLTALAFLRPGDPVLILEPTYEEYRRASLLMGAVVHTYRAQADANFQWDTNAVEQRLRECPYRVIWLCYPNNPTGQALSIAALDKWTAAFPGTLFVVDEAYIPFVPELPSALSLRRPNLLVLRSLTKDYALPGLRVGYAVGDPAIVAVLRQVQPPWSVNAMAQAAGVAALSVRSYVQESVQRLRRAKAALVRQIEALGWPVVPSLTPFFLVRVGNARQFRERLLARGILVRDATSFGLPEYVRVATRRPEENARLIQTLATLSL